MWEGLVLLVDDARAAAEDSIAALKHFVTEDQIVYTASVEGAKALLSTEPVTLVFIDIEMPGESGFDLAGYLQEHHRGLPYVFLTGHADFALEGYDYEPLDFLTKPVDIPRMERTFERLEDRAPDFDGGKLAVRCGGDYIMVSPREIAYICKEKRKVWIQRKDGERYQVAASLDELERIFTDYGFFRCHQSFLIPLSDVKEIQASKFGQTYEVSLKTGHQVPVSRGKYARLKEELERTGILFVRSIGKNEQRK